MGHSMGSGIEHSTFYGYDNVFPLRNPEWTDLQVPINALRLSGVKPPAWTNYKGSQVLAFTDQGIEANEEVVFFAAQLPSAYAEGTNLNFHVHWAGQDNTPGNVVWKFSYSWANVGGIFPTETVASAVAANGATDALLEVDVASLDGTGKKIQSMLLCSLRRNSSNAADTFTGKSAYLMEADFHLQVNTLGSQSEDSKS
jgi:hypothetical protein